MNEPPDVCHTVVIGDRMVLWRDGDSSRRRCVFTPVRRLTLLGRPRADGGLGPKKQIKLCGVHHQPIIEAVTAQRLAVIEDVRIARDWAHDAPRARS